MKFRQPGGKQPKLIRAGEALGGFEIPESEFDARRDVNTFYVNGMEALIETMVREKELYKCIDYPIKLAEALQYIKPVETNQVLMHFPTEWLPMAWEDALIIAIFRLFPDRISKLRKNYWYHVRESKQLAYDPK